MLLSLNNVGLLGSGSIAILSTPCNPKFHELASQQAFLLIPLIKCAFLIEKHEENIPMRLPRDFVLKSNSHLHTRSCKCCPILGPASARDVLFRIDPRPELTIPCDFSLRCCPRPQVVFWGCGGLVEDASSEPISGTGFL